MNVCTKCPGDPSTRCLNITLKRTTINFSVAGEETPKLLATHRTMTHTHTHTTPPVTGNLVTVPGRDVHTLKHKSSIQPTDPSSTSHPRHPLATLYPMQCWTVWWRQGRPWDCSLNTRIRCVNRAKPRLPDFMCAERCLPTFPRWLEKEKGFMAWIHSPR